MAKARLDKKGRKLNTGEYQNADGRYVYHYTDKNGKKSKRTINPIIVVPDRKIKQKGNKIEESEDLG